MGIQIDYSTVARCHPKHIWLVLEDIRRWPQFDPEAIESATQTLTTASHKLAEEMYKKASASAAAGAGATGGESPNGAKTDEKVVDAEFEEVDKDKK